MKERPILFSGPMVRSILGDFKTKTRRGISRLNGFSRISEFGRSSTRGYDFHFRDNIGAWNDVRTSELLVMCPYGVVGDRLWVRESIKRAGGGACWYCADDAIVCGTDDLTGKRMPAHYRYNRSSLPSIHMPRDWCRILLEIVNVSVERLNDITQEDAVAEGMRKFAGLDSWGVLGSAITGSSAVELFALLWESLNGAGSWLENPFVWVIEFKRVSF